MISNYCQFCSGFRVQSDRLATDAERASDRELARLHTRAVGTLRIDEFRAGGIVKLPANLLSTPSCLSFC